MIAPNRAFSFYGGMAIPPPRSEDPQVTVYAVLVHPKVLRLFGKNALDHMVADQPTFFFFFRKNLYKFFFAIFQRHTFIEQLLRFVEEANNITLSRMCEVLKDQDIVGELKEVWMAVQCQRDMEIQAQMDYDFGSYNCEQDLQGKMFIEGQQQQQQQRPEQQFMHRHHHQQPPQYPSSYPPPPPMPGQENWFEYTAKANERIEPEFWNTVQHIEDIIPSYPVQNVSEQFDCKSWKMFFTDFLSPHFQIPIQMLPMFMSEVTSTILQPSVYYQPARQQQNDHFHHQNPTSLNNEFDNEDTLNGVPVKCCGGVTRPKRRIGNRYVMSKTDRIQTRMIQDNAKKTQAKREAAVSNANDYSRIISNVVRMTESTKSQRVVVNKNGYRYNGPRDNCLANEESRGPKEVLTRQGKRDDEIFCVFDVVNWFFFFLLFRG